MRFMAHLGQDRFSFNEECACIAKGSPHLHREWQGGAEIPYFGLERQGLIARRAPTVPCHPLRLLMFCGLACMLAFMLIERPLGVWTGFRRYFSCGPTLIKR